MNPLESYFNTNTLNLKREELVLLIKSFSTVKLKRGEYLLKVGELCDRIFFVEKGALVYFTRHQREEKVCGFAFENDWVTNIKSLSTSQPTDTGILAITSATLHCIKAKDYMDLVAEHANLINFRVLLTEQYFIGLNQRANDLANLSSEELYLKIIQEKPQLVNRVPQHYLASYMGIKPQSLSRIRKSIQK